jgi:pyruvate dehydrogenase E2 component (dihydrolipoamide acetyltransferase)
MSQLIEVKVPDIGDYHDVPVIDICVKVGDVVKVDDALVTLESDKATMDVPSSVAGVVKEIRVKLGDKDLRGRGRRRRRASERWWPAIPAAARCRRAGERSAACRGGTCRRAPAPPLFRCRPVPSAAGRRPGPGARTHASPSVRLLARELGVDLNKVTASGPKGRILKEDITAYVKGVHDGASGGRGRGSPSLGGGLDLLPWPKVDFAKFGAVEVKPLARIKKISAQNLARNWVMIPRVTYHEDADITDLEAFRVAINRENEKVGPQDHHAGFPDQGLHGGAEEVPRVQQLARRRQPGAQAVLPHRLRRRHAERPGRAGDQERRPEIGQPARRRKRRTGHEGARRQADAGRDVRAPASPSPAWAASAARSFSPIVNAPEVAILGVSKSVMKPVWNGRSSCRD